MLVISTFFRWTKIERDELTFLNLSVPQERRSFQLALPRLSPLKGQVNKGTEWNKRQRDTEKG